MPIEICQFIYSILTLNPLKVLYLLSLRSTSASQLTLGLILYFIDYILHLHALVVFFTTTVRLSPTFSTPYPPFSPFSLISAPSYICANVVDRNSLPTSSPKLWIAINFLPLREPCVSPHTSRLGASVLHLHPLPLRRQSFASPPTFHLSFHVLHPQALPSQRQCSASPPFYHFGTNVRCHHPQCPSPSFSYLATWSCLAGTNSAPLPSLFLLALAVRHRPRCVSWPSLCPAALTGPRSPRCALLLSLCLLTFAVPRSLRFVSSPSLHLSADFVPYHYPCTYAPPIFTLKLCSDGHLTNVQGMDAAIDSREVAVEETREASSYQGHKELFG